MMVLPAPVLMVAAPAVTAPPEGSANALPAIDTIMAAARVFNFERVSAPEALLHEEVFLPALLAFSETATKVALASFQMDR
jgi:hypothetical protein